MNSRFEAKVAISKGSKIYKQTQVILLKNEVMALPGHCHKQSDLIIDISDLSGPTLGEDTTILCLFKDYWAIIAEKIIRFTFLIT
ncbi:hypothetical protein V202x_14080 [Gimesia aquarii]|uniref:Uncharacterized protein n=1 Tax=Gimesia aquarii TaxID=2527964 RepID=A0A517WS07_9PLAN|nr:hypothetical protein V202x_14080 [Gimesia aquarii]